MTVIEHQVAPGEGFAATVERLRAEHGEFSELRVGATTIGIGEDRARACDATEKPGEPSCDFCCRILGVAALKKYPRQTCRHLDRHRCAIYERRPEGCSAYTCGWKLGNWPLAWRPDKIGCVVSFHEDPSAHHLVAVMNIDSATLARDPIAREAVLTMFDRLCADFPEVKQIVDDKRILVAKAGAGVRQGHMMPRARGTYEDARYVLDEELR